MKRREFIINSSVLLTAATLLAGCTNKMTDNISEIKEEKTVELPSKINCSGCNHCVEVCPQRINIPKVFSIYNNYKATNNKDLFIKEIKNLEIKPEECIKCEICKRNCKLPIPELLEQISKEYQKISG